MIHYFHEISENGIIYSIDMIRLRLDFNSMERIQSFGNWLSSPFLIHVIQYPLSTKAYSYRYLFDITCSNGSSFVCGLGLNGSDSSSGWIGFCEFNPNKVAAEKEFAEFWDKLEMFCPWAEISRYDIAIDVPVRRSLCSLSKDKRKYTLVQNSNEDVTEYLGNRGQSGYCKLYNKKLESKLDMDVTRFEITLDYDVTYSEALKLFPVIDVTESQLDLTSGLRDTQLVLVDLLKRLPIYEQRYYFNRLGRVMKNKIKPYVFSSVDRFLISREVFAKIRIELRHYTIGATYSTLDLGKDLL